MRVVPPVSRGGAGWGGAGRTEHAQHALVNAARAHAVFGSYKEPATQGDRAPPPDRASLPVLVAAGALQEPATLYTPTPTCEQPALVVPREHKVVQPTDGGVLPGGQGLHEVCGQQQATGGRRVVVSRKPQQAHPPCGTSTREQMHLGIGRRSTVPHT